MSEMYGFGVEENEPTPDAAVAPKFYRDYMEKVSKQLQALQDRNDALEARQRQQQVAEALTAKGYAPQAAGLFTGDPAKLDDWLSAHGAALAKQAAPEGEPQSQAPAGPPPTVVSPESQAALAQMAAAGTDGTAALAGDDQLAARLAAAQTEDEYNAIMRAAGNQHF